MLFMRSWWRDNHGFLAGFAEAVLSRYRGAAMTLAALQPA